jgi:hypothetical protein
MKFDEIKIYFMHIKKMQFNDENTIHMMKNTVHMMKTQFNDENTLLDTVKFL